MLHLLVLDEKLAHTLPLETFLALVARRELIRRGESKWSERPGVGVGPRAAEVGLARGLPHLCCVNRGVVEVLHHLQRPARHASEHRRLLSHLSQCGVCPYLRGGMVRAESLGF